MSVKRVSEQASDPQNVKRDERNEIGSAVSALTLGATSGTKMLTGVVTEVISDPQVYIYVFSFIQFYQGTE